MKNNKILIEESFINEPPKLYKKEVKKVIEKLIKLRNNAK